MKLPKIKIDPVEWAVALLILFWGISFIIPEDREQEADYELELDNDRIYVRTQEGDTYIVHPDSLEEFINKDNL